MSEMDAIAPRPVAVAYRGKTYDLRPLTVGATPEIVRLARPVVDALLLGESADEAGFVGTLMDLIGMHGEAIFRAVSLASGVAEDDLRAGELDEFVALLLAVWRLNRDFFSRRLAPLLAGWRAEAAPVSPGAGQMPSST